MELVVLVENSSAHDNLEPEFGLSILISCESGRILFDVGATSRFAENAGILGEDLGQVDCAVISHAHYDHGGGLRTFLELNDTAPVYVGNHFDGHYYANIGAKMPAWLEPLLYPLVKRSVLFSKYVGIERQLLAQQGKRLVRVATSREICPDVFLLAEILEPHPFPQGNKYLLERAGSGLQEDRFLHELILVIREHDGLVLFTGCGHRSIRNMVATVQERFAGEVIKGVVGGFHLALKPGKQTIGGSREAVRKIGYELAAAGVKRVITGHCTGKEGCAVLSEVLHEKFFPLATGLRYLL